MGKLIVTEFMTLDGVAQAPGAPDEDREGGFPYGGWQAPLETPESGGNVVFEEASTMDALLLGRKTYEIFAASWPFAPDEILSPDCSTGFRSTWRAGLFASRSSGRTLT
jgi:dihydrofolate reductase